MAIYCSACLRLLSICKCCTEYTRSQLYGITVVKCFRKKETISINTVLFKTCILLKILPLEKSRSIQN